MSMLSRKFVILLGITTIFLLSFNSHTTYAQTKILAEFENVVVDETPCGLSSMWPDSSAKAKIKQADGETKITIKVKDTVPSVFWTAWIRLAGVSPLSWNGMSRMGSTPMAPMGALRSLAATTPAGNLDEDAFPAGTGDNGEGSDDQINGFFTDETGAGKLKILLDFPLIKGAVPFHELNEDFDPIAIGTSPTVPFTLRIVSHCEDNVGHGLVPGGQLDIETEQPISTNHEIWFEWEF